MVLMTMIARVADALPLAASMQEDEQVSELFNNIAKFAFNFIAKSKISKIYVWCLRSLCQPFESQLKCMRNGNYSPYLMVSHVFFTIIVTVCVFVRHLFSWYPFYFDFHSARIIFDVSSGFYLWNINNTKADICNK